MVKGIIKVLFYVFFNFIDGFMLKGIIMLKGDWFDKWKLVLELELFFW